MTGLTSGAYTLRGRVDSCATNHSQLHVLAQVQQAIGAIRFEATPLSGKLFMQQ